MSVGSLRVAVVFGGDSAERGVSIASALQIIPALRSRGHCVMAVDLRDGPIGDELQQRSLKEGSAGYELAVHEHGSSHLNSAQLLDWIGEADVTFLALHGGVGENGAVQTILELGGKAYTGSGPLGSCIAMDKDVSKRLYQQAGIPTANWRMVERGKSNWRAVEKYPVVVKPNRQGSTIGLSLVREPGQLEGALELAFRFDDEAMIEDFILGRELTVGILDGQPLAVGEVLVTHDAIFDFETKYLPGAVKEQFPAEIDQELAERLRDYSLRAHCALKLKGYSRTDFRVTDDGAIFCLETNTLPGMTATSLLPQSALAAGIPFDELCERICLMAIRPR
mgnify:CR=1 FL=1